MEYRQSHPDGCCYSHFCKHLQELDDARNLTMANLPHPPGEQTYIDFAGKYAEYVDSVDGEIHQVPVLLLTLGHIHYSYVEAFDPKKARTWCTEFGAGSAFSVACRKPLFPIT